MEATLQQILDARENRVARQRVLLEKYQKPLLCFTMNIPGPEKWNRDVSIGFSVGSWLIASSLDKKYILHFEVYREITGCEAYYVVDLPAKKLKQIAIEIEETDPIGRLFDLDVLEQNGAKLTRAHFGRAPRKCLICQQDAMICARSRAHGLQQLQERTKQLLQIAAEEWMAEWIAAWAYTALQQEVRTTPKPGLVDRNNQGSHKDMSLRHFFASANALRPFFCAFTREGFHTRDLPAKETFKRIRKIGLDAEKAMYGATGGVNTHKGAIFSLGLLCAAAGRLSPDSWSPTNLLAECAAMTEGIVNAELEHISPDSAITTGEKLFAQYGITGIRGQAEAGFPVVKEIALPTLNHCLKNGYSLNDAGCIALLNIIANTDDTNLIHRSNRQTQLAVQQRIRTLLKDEPFPRTETIMELDHEFIEKNLSPGGSADLLAMTYFLYFLQECNP